MEMAMEFIHRSLIFFGNAIMINPSSLGDDNQFVLVANGYVYFSELFSE